MHDRNIFKEKIGSGRPVIGTWNTLGEGLVTEVLARSGLDFIILDFEHGPFLIESVHALVNACEPHGCSPIVRLPANEDWLVLQALDQGAHGVMVPQVDTVEEAWRFCEAAKYAPVGRRGYSPFTKAGGFSREGAQGYVRRANEATITAILIESETGLRNLDAILDLPELDVVYFGAYDLSLALGCKGGTKDRSLRKRIESAAAKVNAAGKCPGGFVPESLTEIQRLLDMGLRFITFGVDCALLYNPLRAVVEHFRARGAIGSARSRVGKIGRARTR